MTHKSLLSTILTLLSLSLIALATTTTTSSSIPETDYDVIVVGGGPSGLSALSSLARVRRRAAIFDSGEYRNAPTREMHDVIGNDGTPPSQFRALARTQIQRYPSVSIHDSKIVSIVSSSPNTNPNTNTSTSNSNSNFIPTFHATTSTGQTYTARKIILGTGLVDLLPANVPGLLDAWGKGIWWCPWCDGWEHRDEPLGILGSLVDVMGSVLETHTLYDDVVAFTNGSDTLANRATLEQKYSSWEAKLKAWNVTIDDRPIHSIERLQDGDGVDDHEDQDSQGRVFDLFRLHFVDGSTVDRGTFITNYPTAQRSDLPAQLGIKMEDGKVDTSDYSGMRTSVSGVFAVGDCNSDGSTNVPHAMFSGKRAGVFVHVEMSREESTAAISKRERDFDRRALEKQTERMVGDEMEVLWKRVLEMHKY
ncbi:FAD/NAD(P)-binding domain-containing protein [Aspergillus heteromorphus CBS 117.55]|uniref:FAD/NAD(P)-binding domain-containing protein n=1 Tax=Aspergillus heteromorphus CBS 117.55 TaxID=1448321 RepID=A0A317W155_9EURO|nr:FAD/NAD(P)-binding domain-containing protein [Aspergillus heteromorphus CBS 117.55]PWY79619.1 FAD/NAD(P)-binding domain-containing protein [Aspergillus heteromorphus CBS 117.55]